MSSFVERHLIYLWAPGCVVLMILHACHFMEEAYFDGVTRTQVFALWCGIYIVSIACVNLWLAIHLPSFLKGFFDATEYQRVEYDEQQRIVESKKLFLYDTDGDIRLLVHRTDDDEFDICFFDKDGNVTGLASASGIERT